MAEPATELLAARQRPEPEPDRATPREWPATGGGVAQDRTEHGQACRPVPTGIAFDAITAPPLLGCEVYRRLEARGYRMPVAILNAEVVFLVAAGSSWQDASVPAALTVYTRGDQLRLPQPTDTARWLCPPTTGRIPGFLALLPVVREVLNTSHGYHLTNPPPD